MLCDDIDHAVPIDWSEPRRADSADEMVYRVEQEGVQADEVAGDQKRQDLSPAIRQDAVATGHSVSDHGPSSSAYSRTSRSSPPLCRKGSNFVYALQAEGPVRSLQP